MAKPKAKHAPGERKPPPDTAKPGESKFRPEFIPIAAKLALQGFIQEEMAEFFDVSQSTWKRWLKSHPELAEAVRVPIEKCDERVAMSLYRMTQGYHVDETETRVTAGVETKVTRRVYIPPVPAAAIFWQKARSGWRENKPLPPEAMPVDQEQVDGMGVKQEPIRNVARRIALVLHEGNKNKTG